MILSPDKLAVGMEVIWQGTFLWHYKIVEICHEYKGFYLEGNIWHTFEELKTWNFLEVKYPNEN
jgi:hypothetical protein